MSDEVLKLAFGGLTNLDKNAANIRKHQIDNGHRLHSCFFYAKSLDVIREATNCSGTVPQMSTKVYYNFWGNRPFKGIHNSIYGQLELIVERLGFILKNWHVQICNVTKIDPLTMMEFRKFKKKVGSNFGQVYFFK